MPCSGRSIYSCFFWAWTEGLPSKLAPSLWQSQDLYLLGFPFVWYIENWTPATTVHCLNSIGIYGNWAEFVEQYSYQYFSHKKEKYFILSALLFLVLRFCSLVGGHQSNDWARVTFSQSQIGHQQNCLVNVSFQFWCTTCILHYESTRYIYIYVSHHIYIYKCLPVVLTVKQYVPSLAKAK